MLVSEFSRRFILYYNVSSDTYVMNEPSEGTLFKRRAAAESVKKLLGKRISIVKYTKKHGKLNGSPGSAKERERRMIDPKKQARIDEVKALLADFSKQHLASAPDIAGYIEKLWDQIGRKRSYVITGGTKEVWASAVVYVIARLNFLFDKASPNYLIADTICDHFGTKKGRCRRAPRRSRRRAGYAWGMRGCAVPDFRRSDVCPAFKRNGAP